MKSTYGHSRAGVHPPDRWRGVNWHIFGILVPAEHRYWIMDALRAEGDGQRTLFAPAHEQVLQSPATDDENARNNGVFQQVPEVAALSFAERSGEEYVVTAVKKVFKSH